LHRLVNLLGNFHWLVSWIGVSYDSFLCSGDGCIDLQLLSLHLSELVMVVAMIHFNVLRSLVFFPHDSSCDV